LQAKNKVSDAKNKRYETEDNYVKYLEGASLIKISDNQISEISAYEGGQYTSINGDGLDLNAQSTYDHLEQKAIKEKKNSNAANVLWNKKNRKSEKKKSFGSLWNEFRT